MVLSKDGDNILSLKKAHDALALAIRTSSSASVFAIAMVLGESELLQNLNLDLIRLRQALLKLKRALAFMPKANFAIMQFSGRFLEDHVPLALLSRKKLF